MNKRLMSKIWAIGLILSCQSVKKNSAELDLRQFPDQKQKGDVTYCYDDSLGIYLGQVEQILDQTIGEWTRYASINYIKVPCEKNPLYRIQKVEEPDSARAYASYSSGHLSLNLIDGKLLNGDGTLKAGHVRGISLHEWGHTLGFVHEHNEQGVAITAKDNRSIMYYPHTRGSYVGGDWDRAVLSLLDKTGAINEYPSTHFNTPSNGSPEVFSDERETHSSSCAEGSVMIGLACYGDSCDNKRMYCAKPALLTDIAPVPATSVRFQEPNFVETQEGFVKTMQCDGKNCAFITLGYNHYPGLQLDACEWSPEFSNEEGSSKNEHHHICSKGKGVTGVACSGKRCDNLKIRCCSYSVP